MDQQMLRNNAIWKWAEDISMEVSLFEQQQFQDAFMEALNTRFQEDATLKRKLHIYLTGFSRMIDEEEYSSLPPMFTFLVVPRLPNSGMASTKIILQIAIHNLLFLVHNEHSFFVVNPNNLANTLLINYGLYLKHKEKQQSADVIRMMVDSLLALARGYQN